MARKEKKPAPAGPQSGAGGRFELVSAYRPAGDQGEAIDKLCEGLAAGERELTLLGVTGSGKTYTAAGVVARLNRPTMVIAHNKTLAAQLYAEFRGFFPANAVEYFVSYYDYYQPEAYVPARDLFIDKDSSVNEHIEQLRLSATKSLMERRDVLIVATVSALFGIGDPVDYHSMVLHLRTGEELSRHKILRRLVQMQYRRDKHDFKRGTFRVRGDVVDVFPAENSDKAVRIELLDDRIEEISLFDPLTGRRLGRTGRFTVYPSSHYVAAPDSLRRALKGIGAELRERERQLLDMDQAVYAHRLRQRTMFDLEMMREIGFCKGIENYSRHLSGRRPGEPPPTLFDYLPADALLVVDESHVTVPQIGGMWRGDRSRKDTLVEYGFRLPSARDNRPLTFEEFERIRPQTVYVSATPAEHELSRSARVVEQVVRPTGLVDPQIDIRPAATQVDDLLGEIKACVAAGSRALVTTLTKRMAEQLAEYLGENAVRVRYLHADIETIERARIISDLRRGSFDVLVGINLLREGLDLPEVALVAILDADKEGFLRSERSLIQTIGRAARNVAGRAILYADKRTGSIERACAETDRRRRRQLAYNRKHRITPQGVQKAVADLIDGIAELDERKPAGRRAKLPELMSAEELGREVRSLEKGMLAAAARLEFEKAAELRDQIRLLQDSALGLASAPAPARPGRRRGGR